MWKYTVPKPNLFCWVYLQNSIPESLLQLVWRWFCMNDSFIFAVLWVYFYRPELLWYYSSQRFSGLFLNIFVWYLRWESWIRRSQLQNISFFCFLGPNRWNDSNPLSLCRRTKLESQYHFCKCQIGQENCTQRCLWCWACPHYKRLFCSQAFISTLVTSFHWGKLAAA